MDALDVVLLVVGGLFAGCVNTIAGGGSLLTVPLLVLVGVPGDVANGTNRLGILTSNVSAAEAFRRQGVAGLSRVVPVLVPVVVGALVGSVLISRVDAGSFERVFGVLMVLLLLLSLRPPQIQSATHLWSARTAVLTQAIGLSIGLLTANLVTIVFVLTLSHVVFMTANWLRAAEEQADRALVIQSAIQDTLEASFWSMTTTLLGFASLLIATAQPLRELGIRGRNRHANRYGNCLLCLSCVFGAMG